MNGYNRTLASHHLESYQASNSRKMKTCGVEKVTTLNVGWEGSIFFKLESLIYCLLPRHGGGKKSHVRSSRGLPTTQCIIYHSWRLSCIFDRLLQILAVIPVCECEVFRFPIGANTQSMWRNNFEHKTNDSERMYTFLLSGAQYFSKPRLWKLIDVCREHHISVALQSWCQS